jgi:uncharacterized membrane protein YphA (DoxX/SURF4 family)
MNAALWVLQVIMSATFMYSGINKSLFSIKKLVYEKGQTGVENLPLSFVRFIGISEILGAIALILPWLLNTLPFLTSITAFILAFIMVPAAVIHYKRKEYKNVGTNIIIFCICIFIGYGRLFL